MMGQLDEYITRLVENSPVAMAVSSGVEEQVLFLNKKFTDLFGYTIEDIPDISYWWTLAYPDAQYRREIKSKWSAAIAEAVKKKSEIEPLEATVTCKEGTQRHIQFHFSSVGERNLVIFIDTTERERAEAALHRSEEQFRSIVSAMDEGVVFQRKSGEITTVNPAAERILGLTAAELMGRTSAGRARDAEITHEDGSVFPGEDHPSMITLRTGKPQSNVVMGIHRPDESLVWISVNSQPLLSNGESEPHAVVTTFRDITRQKEVEKALQTSEEKFAAAFHASPNLMAITRMADGTILEVNESYTRLLGYTREESIGRTTAELSIWADPADRATFVSSLEESGQITDFETSLRRKDGTVITVIDSARFIEFQGEPCALSVVHDITERKQAEQALQTSEAGLKEAQHLAQIGSWEWDAATDSISWSDEYYHIYGIEPGSNPPAYDEHLQAYTAESAARLDAAVKKSMEAGTPYELDLELAEPTATTKWISAHGEVKRDSNGEIVGLRGTAQNITYRKQSEEALQRSEEKFRTLFEDSKDTVIITSPQGNILDINAAGVELLGYETRDELLQVDIAEKVYANPDDRKQMLGKLRRHGFLKDYELGFKTKAGEILHVSASVSSESDAEGDIIALRSIIRDMTEHQRLEEQLRQSQKMESIGQLAGGVAHDFNNYLTAIEGYTDLALMKLPEDSPVRQELQESHKSCERAADLSRQLLIFSRKEPIRPKPINLNVVVTDLLKMLSRLIGERYTVTTFLEEDLWTVSADVSHIEQVIVNLSVNARDAMPEGGEIAIRTENCFFDKEYASSHPGSRIGKFVRISVKDTGAGMDAETLSHIYEPFYTTKAAAKGTGLGLSVVYGIITQHDGWMDVESSPGRGTTFYVFVPASPVQKNIADRETAPLERFKGHGEKILLVEDEESVRNMVETMLSRNGYSVTAAASAEEATKIFNETNGDFQLVFSDVILPQENGIALADRLLRQKPELRVLLASGYSDTASLETMHERGYQLLQKPYSLQPVLKTIGELLRGDKPTG